MTRQIGGDPTAAAAVWVGLIPTQVQTARAVEVEEAAAVGSGQFPPRATAARVGPVPTRALGRRIGSGAAVTQRANCREWDARRECLTITKGA